MPRIAPLRLLLPLLLALLPALAAAQIPGLGAPAEEEAPAAAAPVGDPLGRETPRGAVSGLLDALAAEDLGRAARYLEVPDGLAAPLDPALVREVEMALDAAATFRSPTELSIAPLGDLNDGLDPSVDIVGALATPDGEVPLVARRGDPEPGSVVPDGAEPDPVWRVSGESVEALLRLDPEAGLGMASLRAWLGALPAGPLIFGVPLRDWGLLVALAVLSYLLAWSVTGILRAVGHRLARRRADDRLARFIIASEPPLRVLLASVIFTLGIGGLGVSVVARYQTGFIVNLAAWFAGLWFLWRVVDAFARATLEGMSKRGAVTAYSVTTFVNRLLKALIVAIFVAIALRSFGVDITAGLAALGVGGLALALGAQKLVENLIGSFTLIADRPVRVGDFCRFGTTLGTVEEIGIRSTRIRTLDRTVVTIPNGEFSNLHLENYALRDIFLFKHVINLRYETDPRLMREVLGRLREVLRSNPAVTPDPARVRLVALGPYSKDVEFFAYVRATDINDYLEKQEELILRIMEVVEESGSGFAFPSQTLYLGRDDLTGADIGRVERRGAAA